MKLWLEVYRCICLLRPACSRAVTFAWMMLTLVGMCARPDMAGVTSLVRAGWLKESCYLSLLHIGCSRVKSVVFCRILRT